FLSGLGGAGGRICRTGWKSAAETRTIAVAMPEKHFKIAGSDMKPLLAGVACRGGCFATDTITVEGRRVGYMYREPPDFPDDSGWRFFSGTESADYLDDPAHTDIYDVNTIANHDAAIVPLPDC